MKTILILVIASQIHLFESHEDLTRFKGQSITHNDALFAKMVRHDETRNANMFALRELPQYHGIPDDHMNNVKVIHIYE